MLTPQDFQVFRQIVANAPENIFHFQNGNGDALQLYIMETHQKQRTTRTLAVRVKTASFPHLSFSYDIDEQALCAGEEIDDNLLHLKSSLAYQSIVEREQLTALLPEATTANAQKVKRL